MTHRIRIGIQIASGDPFWIQLREAIDTHARQAGVELVPIDIDQLWPLNQAELLGLIDELLVQDTDALIASSCPEFMAQRLFELGLPIVHLTEHDLRHPLFSSPLGLYEVGQIMGRYIGQRLAGRGRVLVLGGKLQPKGEDGGSRIDGFRDALSAWPAIELLHIASGWRYDEGYSQLMASEWPAGARLDAIFGLSDSLALAGRDVAQARGLADERTVIVGVNGDPLALAAIVSGGMHATIETPAADMGRQAVDLARRAALGERLPPHYSYQPRLVTTENVAEVAVQKLMAIANLPTRLIGVNRNLEQQRLNQLEASLAISRRVGAVLDRERLALEIANLIRESYGFDVVQLYLWHAHSATLALEPGAAPALPLAQAGLLSQAIEQNELIFVPDTRHSHRFAPDPRLPAISSRAIVPIRLGEQLLGLLDLHSQQPTYHSRQAMLGLQVLADQLGIAMHNAELYGQALRARAAAEQADQLKTRLLANVSHELRTPLNVILGYSSAALASPSPYPAEPGPELRNDLRQIYRAGGHLIRIINDLLDLSRAEIDQLDLFPEPIDTHAFLSELFDGLAHSAGASAVEWRLELPARLPLIQADPVRLRQVLLNLLSNAQKFTSAGQIALGAELLPPELHLWVRDSGIGIAADLQERIFEPFVTGVQSKRRPEGVGLGLSITRRLVALHGGSMQLESAPGQGSTFHIFLPLPSLAGPSAQLPPATRPALALVGAPTLASAEIAELCQRQGWALEPIEREADLASVLARSQLVALAWDMAGASAETWQLIDQIRSQPQLTQLPLIVYSQPAQAGDAGLGLTNFLVKPFGSQALLDAIDAMRPPLGGMVLIVDDDPPARAMYQSLVAQALPQHSLRVAAGGAEALAIAAEQTPALVILDLMMPEVDGFAVLRQLRAQPQTRRVPVMVISGHALSPGDIQQLDHALVTYQSKDVLTADEISAALRGALAGAERLPQTTSLLVKQVVGYIQQHYGRAISRHELASAVGVSKDYLSRIFHQELGISPWEFLNRYRVQQAKALLRETSHSVTEIASLTGFDDLSYFSRVFAKHTGCSPRAYREQRR